MVEVGQEFKSYRDLCKFMGEEVKAGSSKVAQLKRWERYFTFHKKGYKIIIDEVYDEPLEDNTIKCGHNHKNMDIYLPYIHNCFYRHIDLNMNSINIICNVLKIMDEDLLRQTLCRNREKLGLSHEEFLDFADWIIDVRSYVIRTVNQGLNVLKRSDMIDYDISYAFLSKPKKIRYMAYVSGFNDYIDETECEVCNQIKKAHHISTKLSGSRLRYIVLRQKKLRTEFRNKVISSFLNNPALMSALKASCSEVFHNIDFGSEKYPIEGYWKVWSVMGVKEPDKIDLDAARRAYIDLIIKKTSPKHKIPQKWLKMVFGIDIIKAE